ncbi:MAG: DUF3137 domain-containing protein [Thermoplasmatota archaeon]
MVAEVLAFIAIALVIGGAFVYQWWARNQRMKRLQAWADQHGATYEPIDRSLADDLPGLTPYGMGSGRKARHVIRGRHKGRSFIAFQYEYTVSNGKSSTTYYFRILRVRAPISGHGLSIQREHFGHKIADALGGEDIDFESDAFSKRFWVQCKDRRFAYDIITPEMMEYLMPTRLHWQWSGQTLQVHEKGRIEPRLLDALLEDVEGFLERLPRHRLA